MVVVLTPLRQVELDATLGHKVHAAFLDSIRQVDPDLSETLHHTGERVRPFCVSGLQTERPASNGRITLTPACEYWLRFCVLEPTLFQRFMQRFIQPNHRPLLHLGQADLLIKEILVTPGAHPWSGFSQWQTLSAPAAPQRKISLQFASPTGFSFGQKDWGRHIVVLPQPQLVFASLLRSWNLLAPPELGFPPDPLTAYLEEDVVVKRLTDIRTRMLSFGRSPQIGFTGQVTFGLMRDDPSIVRQLNALADFAFYAGVGMKTAMGMGQVRRLPG